MIFKDHDLSFQVHEERQVKQWVNERQFYNYMQQFQYFPRCS